MRKLVAAVWLALGAIPTTSYAAPPKPAPSVVAKPKSLAETLTRAAKADYESARVLVGDGDFAGALIKFQAAYEASKDPRLLWNVAASEKQLRHYAKAIALLKKYAADSGGLVTPKDRDEAAELIKTLDPFTVALTIDVTEPDASVEVDDVAVGTTPLASPVVVDIGQRKVRVRKEGFRELASTTSIGGSATQTLTVKLEKEVHQGALAIQVPRGASIFVDGQPVPASTTKEPAEVRLQSGGHTLRVTAPKMRAYDREVVVRDNETRLVEVQLEAEGELERPTLRVAVGCVTGEAKTVDDGLALYIDGSPAAAVASGGKKKWNAELAREVVDYVAFSVPSGNHQVEIRIPDCLPALTAVDVTPGTGGELRGALRSASPAFVRGPAGNPDWGRIAVGLWLPGSIGGDGLNGLKFSGESESALQGLRYRPSGTGILIQPGIVLRWLTLSLDLGYATGSATLGQHPAADAPEVLAAVDNKPTVSWLRTGIRAGLRIPLNVAAFHLGGGAGIDNIVFTDLAPGIKWDRPLLPYGSLWTMLEIHALCDLPLYAGTHFDLHTDTKAVTYGLQFGGAYQPNKTCRAERGTSYEVTSRSGASSQ